MVYQHATYTNIRINYDILKLLQLMIYSNSESNKETLSISEKTAGGIGLFAIARHLSASFATLKSF